MTPLSMEKESVGRPAMFHSLILTGSPRVLLRLKSLEQDTFKDCMVQKSKVQNYNINFNVPHHRLTYLTTASRTSPLPHVPHHRLTYLTTVSRTSPLPHVPHHCLTYLTTASCTSPLPHVPHHCLPYLTTASRTSPLPHVPHTFCSNQE